MLEGRASRRWVALVGKVWDGAGHPDEDQLLMPVRVPQPLERAFNMSSLAHFEAYTAGTGGASGAFNRVNIAAIKVLPR